MHELIMKPSKFPLTLEHMPLRQPCFVHTVQPPAHAPEWLRWLEEIGFISGEQVMLTARGMPGGDPLVVRVGTSTFALRRAEASCIQVSMTAPGAPR